MVADGIRYGIGLTGAGLVITYLTGNVAFGIPLFVLAAFCLYFFRDPDRVAPDGPVAVSPADGKVVLVRDVDGRRRVSIFLNIFDVHVNRSPVAGTVTEVKYHKGQFLVASKEGASSDNERNTVSVQMSNGSVVVFSQIAGLIARRIVCWKKAGDSVQTGERVGLIKFGSRVDVFFGPEWDIKVQPGMRVSAGTSVLARLKN